MASAERDVPEPGDDSIRNDASEPLEPEGPVEMRGRTDDGVAIARDSSARAGEAGPAGGGRRLWARIGVGLVGIVLAGTTVWAVEAAPLPGYELSPSGMVLSPVPGEQQRVCPGPLTLLGQSASNPTEPGYKGHAEITAAGNVTDDLDITGIVPAIETPNAPAAPTDEASGVPAYFQAPGAIDDEATSLSIAQSVATSEPGAAGFAATACTQASADQWLVGGSTAGGSSTVLSLVNPTSVNAVVRIDLQGIEGALPTSGLDGIEVPAGAQIAVGLEGAAPEEQAFVAHVTTRGSVVGASLHEVGLEGLQPHGMEMIGPSPQPSPRLDFVGVPFPTTSNEEDESIFANRGATLRLFAPGDEPVNATVTLRDESGTALEPLEVPLAPDVVSDVPLGAYPVGRYTVTVDADAPVVGGLRTSLVTEPYDFAWYQASTPLDGAVDVAVPPGPQPRLHLASASTIPVDVTLEHPDGATERITIAPGTTTSVDVEAGTYRLAGMLDTVASVTFDGPGQMSGIPVVAGSPLAADVTVYR